MSAYRDERERITETFVNEDWLGGEIEPPPCPHPPKQMKLELRAQALVWVCQHCGRTRELVPFEEPFRAGCWILSALAFAGFGAMIGLCWGLLL